MNVSLKGVKWANRMAEMLAVAERCILVQRADWPCSGMTVSRKLYFPNAHDMCSTLAQHREVPMRSIFGLVTVFVMARAAVAQTPAFDPRRWQGQHDGSPTQVLTIGSTHIGQLKVAVTPEMLAPLLDKLAAFKPDIITHEGISGEQCDTLKRYSAKYPGMFNTYCWPTDQAEKATGLSLFQRQWLKWTRPWRPGPPARRRSSVVTLPPCSSPRGTVFQHGYRGSSFLLTSAKWAMASTRLCSKS
jgi:hypothetical protein